MKRLRCVLLALALLGCAAHAAATPPNIVLFLADDLGWADVPWHGSTDKLPNLDRLAREAVRWLEQRGTRPFLLYVPFTAIHVPIVEEDQFPHENAQ